MEDQNFALFNFVNEQNGDIEMLQEHRHQLLANIEHFKSEGVEMEQRRKVILCDMEKELEEVMDKKSGLDAHHSAVSKILDQLNLGKKKLHGLLTCDYSKRLKVL